MHLYRNFFGVFMGSKLQSEPLLRPSNGGLYCSKGDFYIDPKWPAVEQAVITHAHSDHARSGHGHYLAARPGVGLLARRIGTKEKTPPIRAIEYGEKHYFNDVKVSLHPAGHLLGSAQVRVEADGEVWVVTGDYKRGPDRTCADFEVVPCDVFITEATFAMPIYRWRPASEVVGEIYQWWEANRAEGVTSVLFAYALGKAQRVLAGLAAYTDRQVLLHGAMVDLTEIYRQEGVKMVPTEYALDLPKGTDFSGELVLATPSADGTAWMKRFRPYRTGFASGWMRVRGPRRRRGFDTGFVLSDHVDWDELLETIRETGAQRILATHGNTAILVRYLREELGLECWDLMDAYKEGGPYG